jgi:hypothetical protein
MAIKDLLLSSLPQYCETLASGKEVCFRPMIVSEEKAMLLAKHSENKQTILKTLTNIISTCFGGSKDWSIADFEHMFLLLRAKSIGEVEGFTIKCPVTAEDVNIKINLLKDVKLTKSKANNKVKLNENLVVVFKEPTIKTLAKYPDYKETTEQLYGFMGSCIKQIQNQKEIIDCSELSEKEITEFIENLTSIQFKSITDYFDSLPQVEIISKYETLDGVKREIKIKGLFDYINFFFSHLNLQLFYTQNFQMKYQHNYSLEEIENMIPFERAVYVEQVRAHLNKEKQRLSQNIGAPSNG